jgi:NAD(P)-dependent dehydrogenase (short-subunit alcohol dehydrogenase family)
MTACGVLVGHDRPFVSMLIDVIGAELVRIDPALLASAAWPEEWSDETIVWLHLVPAGDQPDSMLFEASFLMRSAATARRIAAGAGKSLTFIALVPSRGLVTGPLGLSCDLACGALEGLMRNRIGEWSAEGDRLLGVVYAGLVDESIDSQRPPEEVARRTPVGSFGTIVQLADVVRFLGSSRAAYVTGTLVHVDGGWNAYSWIYPARTI